MTNNKAAVRTGKIKVRKMTDEVVFIPSVHFPGRTFTAITTPEIRHKNLASWRYTESLYRTRKAGENSGTAQATADAVKAAFDTAQGGSLVNRSVRREVA